MAFDRAWNTTYEGQPADTENINLGATRIRNLKVDVRERLGVDHSFGDAADTGKHLKVTLALLNSDPATSGTDGFVYTKTVAGSTELFWEDNAGRKLQLTSAGALAAPAPFPSGTVMLFQQAAPPSGWTQVVTNTDKVLRLVNDGSGGATGGSWTISGLTANSSTTVTTTTTTSLSLVLSATATVNAHTLTASELPAHTHNVTVPATTGGAQAGTETSGQINAPANAGTVYTTDNGTGGGSGHSHTATATASDAGSTATSNSSSPATTNTTVSAGSAWRPAYINVIAASKN